MLQSKIAIDGTITGLFAQLPEYIQELHDGLSKKHTRHVRTTIKKMRACLHFGEYIDDKYKGKDLSYFLSLYKIVGAYRTRQISDKRIAPFAKDLGEKSYSQYLAYAEKKQKKAEKKVTALLQQDALSGEALQQHLQETFSSRTKRDIHMYWLTYKEKLDSQIKRIIHKKHVKDDDIHIVRKHYKKLLYLSNMLILHNRRMIDTYDLLQKQMGRRNDHIDLLEELQKYHAKHGKKKVAAVIKTLQKITKKEKKEIIAQLKVIYEKTLSQEV